MKLHYMSIQEMQNMSATEFMAEIKIQKKHRKELSKLMENRLTEPEKILEYLAELEKEETPRNFNFTKQSIEALTPREKRTYYKDTDGTSSVRGLGLTVLPSGKKTFFVSATVEGKSRRIAIPKGKCPDMKVREARSQACNPSAPVGQISLIA